MSLPVAAFCLGAPLWSLKADYQRYAGKSLTSAQVLSSRIATASSRGAPGLYEVDVRYPVGNRSVKKHLVVTTYRRLAPGDAISIFANPQTGDATDDDRFASWQMVGWGALGAIFFVMVGFRYAGKILRDECSLS